MDHNAPFLNAELKEEFYVKMAPGYDEFDANGIPMVERLHKSLDGLRKSLNCWWSAIDTHLMKIGFKNFTSDSCMYIY